MLNVYQQWLAIIGTPERALKLRRRLDKLRPPELTRRYKGELECPDCGDLLPLGTRYCPREPTQCPTTVLLGQGGSRRLYANSEYRPALDAWDTGAITASALLHLCLHVESGAYEGPVLY